jgi:spore maturation protein SpmA
MGPVFLALIAIAVLFALATGRPDALTEATLGSAQDAVELAIKLIGVMAFFLGLVEVVRRGGVMGSLARALRPVFRRLFPDVPDGHPALSAITMNVAANMLGLANAATPFGIKAMEELDRLNGRKGTATDAMALFLAINTSSVALLPLGTIGLRAALDSADPSGIILTSLMATGISTVAAITAAKLLARIPALRRSRPPVVDEAGAPETPPAERDEPAQEPETARWHRGRTLASAAAVLAFVVLAARYAAGAADTVQAVSHVMLPLVILLALLYGWSKGVRVYAALVEGAKEGFQVAIRIIPYLVAILVAVGMFRASGVLELLTGAIAPFTTAVGFPAEAVPMALVRPLSGSGAMGVMVEIMQAEGPDSFVGYLVSTLMGSTETTFYVLAVYGGAVALRRIRHAMAACLIADAFGIFGATLAVHLLIG